MDVPVVFAVDANELWHRSRSAQPWPGSV